jgi:hypothetical protein
MREKPTHDKKSFCGIKNGANKQKINRSAGRDEGNELRSAKGDERRLRNQTIGSKTASQAIF